PFHLKPADPDGVALLGAERAELTFDACPDQLPLEVGGRIGRPPVDARREALHAVTRDSEGFAFALDGPVATAAGERDAALARRRVRSTWRRNSSPRPRPRLAPSMSPGMSATTSSRSSRRATPRFGTSVVNG